jgi:hypothetical protein
VSNLTVTIITHSDTYKNIQVTSIRSVLYLLNQRRTIICVEGGITNNLWHWVNLCWFGIRGSSPHQQTPILVSHADYHTDLPRRPVCFMVIRGGVSQYIFHGVYRFLKESQYIIPPYIEPLQILSYLSGFDVVVMLANSHSKMLWYWSFSTHT